jgi:hypothetical protein
VKGRPLFRLDPGWLFLVPGVAILSTTALMPALDDLARAEAHRAKALALETYRSERLARNLEYLDALRSRDETLLQSLAASQLNLAPADRQVVIGPAGAGGVGGGWGQGASVLDGLDATYIAPTVSMPPDSLLHRLTTNRRTRLWMIAGGAMCVLYGLLPPARREGEGRAKARAASSKGHRWRGMLIPARWRGSRIVVGR